MAKVMLFIDGTWLYRCVPFLARIYGDERYTIDYGKLPHVLTRQVSKCLDNQPLDIVRTYLFGSYAVNHAAEDDSMVQRRLDFFDRLKKQWHYEVEIFPINFRGLRLRRDDRGPHDDEPKEKCVDIALATSMLYFAAIPYAYDIAIAVVGDRDFMPVLQHVRRLGKRVAIASIKGRCAQVLSDPTDRERVKDFDIIWIGDHLAELELKYERRQLNCESPLHRGDRRFFSTYQPNKGESVYCDNCREEFSRQARQHSETANANFGSADHAELLEDPERFNRTFDGVVYSVKRDRQFAFLRSSSGTEYHFNALDLQGISFDDVDHGLRVEFQIKRDPEGSKAGSAINVRLAQDTIDDEASDQAPGESELKEESLDPSLLGPGDSDSI